MYDVHVPLERYEAEMQRFKAQIIQLEDNKEMVGKLTVLLEQMQENHEMIVD